MGGTFGVVTLQEQDSFFRDSFFQVNYGAGMKVKLSHSFFVRFDFKDYTFNLNYRTIDMDVWNGWMHNPVFTGGIGAYF